VVLPIQCLLLRVLSRCSPRSILQSAQPFQMPEACMTEKKKLCDDRCSHLPIPFLYEINDSSRPNEEVCIARTGFVGCSSVTGCEVVYESSLDEYSKAVLDLPEWELAFLGQLESNQSTVGEYCREDVLEFGQLLK
jgi:hypothetical protein